MKYLCLVYIEEKKLDALSKRSKSELAALVDESLDYDEVLRKSGHYIVSDVLHSVQTATTDLEALRQPAQNVWEFDGGILPWPGFCCCPA